MLISDVTDDKFLNSITYTSITSIDCLLKIHASQPQVVLVTILKGLQNIVVSNIHTSLINIACDVWMLISDVTTGF